MTNIDYSDLIGLKYPEVTKVGVLYTSGKKGSYYETFYGKNTVCFDIEIYILFNTRELMWEWLSHSE